MPPTASLADYLPQARKLREASGLTQEEAAQKLRVSLRTFRRWETGEAKPAGQRAVDYLTFLKRAEARSS